MSFDEELKTRISRTEDIVSAYLPGDGDYGARVVEAMNYSFLAGGKRIRPMLMIETHILCGGDGHLVAPFMAALEMIHTYSLVHDDLPAMDGDVLRRGKPTTWKQYDEACAILAGDGLLNYSCETAALAFDMAEDHEDYIRVAASLKILYHHAGIYGMIGGQCADLEAEGKEKTASEEELLYIHEHKTGCLIEAALMAGGALAGASAVELNTREKIGSDIGIAFQIRDDILDIIGDTAELGKKVGSDEANEKVTYVSLNGLEASEREVKRLSDEAKKLLESLPGDKEFLIALTDSLIGRTN